jgi:peptide/nickel transport system ATP-binding protein
MNESNRHLLEIRGLTVHFQTEEGTVQAVEDVSFDIAPREIVGLVGESGSGKTVTSLSILKLIPSPPGHYPAGQIFFNGKDMLNLDEDELRGIRGGKIAYIFQDPMSSLNPVKKIGNQIAESIKLHQGLNHDLAIKKAVEMMDRVSIPSANLRVKEFPHQFSGGMKQRVMIAMALSCNPELLIADEPTTALDVTIQAQILDLMKQLWRDSRASILFITHDLSVIARMCQRVVVMYAGKVVEITPIRELFADPLHPYTEGLLKSRPEFGCRGKRLHVIRGTVPNLVNPPEGCRFHDRCDYAMPVCQVKVPALEQVSKERMVACHLKKGKP